MPQGEWITLAGKATAVAGGKNNKVSVIAVARAYLDEFRPDTHPLS